MCYNKSIEKGQTVPERGIIMKIEQARNFADEIIKACAPFVKGNLNEILECNGFFTAPASTRFHGNFSGGLLLHSVMVADSLSSFNLHWERPESPLLVGLLHDICKVDSYLKTDGGYKYNANCLRVSDENNHGVKSVFLLSQFMDLTEEEKLCIRFHMGAYEVNEWKEYGKAIEKYPNVLFTHTADMYASKVKGI